MAVQYKACPRCGSTVPINVATCPRCGVSFEPNSAAGPGSGKGVDRVSWSVIFFAAIVVLGIGLAVYGLLSQGRKNSGGPPSELRAWLSEKDGYYLETPLDDMNDPEYIRQSDAGRIESHLVHVDGNKVKTYTLITSRTARSGEWQLDLEGDFDGTTWRSRNGSKSLHFDGTGLVDLDGRSYYKVLEPVNNNLDLSVIHMDRENILAGKPLR